MSIPTRAELEALKRTALQAKCKASPSWGRLRELGIKANSKSEMLIDLILEHYQTMSGPSKPSTKRKAQDDVKTRRVKPKIEPQETILETSPRRQSPRRGKVMEVVMRSPAKGRGRGKGKAKAMTPVEDEMDVLKELPTLPVPQAGPALSEAQPLTATATSMTILDTAAEASMPADTRVADLELQIRNARKAGDESAREILALKAFQNAIQQAFNDHNSSDTLDSMGQLAKLRDIAPVLLAASHLDPDAIASRVDAVEKRVEAAGEQLKQDEAEISDLRERIRKLETGMPDVNELEATLRNLQSQFNRIPDSVFNNTRPEDSASDSRYEIIRPSAAPVAGPSNSQLPSSQLSAPQEDGLFPSQNQDQNNGRASSVARSSRSSRPPLAEKEKEPEVETDARRSTRPSSQPQSHQSSQSSRGRSVEPYSRARSSEPPTPSRGKGKSRLIKTSLDTVNEDETPFSVVVDPFTPTTELPRSPPAVTRKSASPASPSANKAAPTFTFLPPLATLGTNGPIAELPFKLIASPNKPSSEVTARPAAPSGRVARVANHRVHTSSVRRPAPAESTEKTAQSIFNFAVPSESTTATNGATNNSSAPVNGHGFITPERLGANFSLFPSTRIDLGRTPGGLAFKTTGRAPPGTPAVTNTLFGTEVARDTRFADLPYDPDASRGSISWEEGLPVWPAGIPRNAANP